MTQVIAIAMSFGLNLSAELVSFIANSQTESEKQEQSRLIAEIEEYQKKKDNEISMIKADLDKKIKKIKEEAEQSKNDYVKQAEITISEIDKKVRRKIKKRNNQIHKIEAEAAEKIHEVQKDFEEKRQKQYEEFINFLCEFIKNKAEERIKSIDKIIDELKENRKNLINFKDKHCSLHRRNALELLISEFQISESKAFAYKQYIKDYCYYSKEIFKNNIEPFEFMLPEHYPYRGAIIYIKPENMNMQTGEGKLIFHNVMEIKFMISDYDKKKIFEHSLPLYVENLGAYYVWQLSISKGAYYLSKRSGGFNGITAVVEKYDKCKNVILKYGKDMELILKPQNLINSKHYPPIKSEQIVYPMYESYDFQLKQECYYVSQRVEDTEISLTFDEIPVVIPENVIDEFCNYFCNNNIDIEYDDAKIAPFNKDNIYSDEMILQFQDNFIMLVVIKEYEPYKKYFEYVRILNGEQYRIKAEDIFVSFHAAIKMMNTDELHDSYDKDTENIEADMINCLILTILKEFKLQQEIIYSQDGIKYFLAWEKLVGKLREYLSVGDKVTCIPYMQSLPEISTDNISKDRIIRYHIENDDVLRKFYNRICEESKYSHIHYDFFIQYNEYKFFVDIHPSCEYVKVIIPDIYKYGNKGNQQQISERFSEKIQSDLMLLTELVIYKQELCIPETRQLSSLYHFKLSHMPNSKLHAYALNSKNIIPETEENADIELLNSDIKQDDSQYNSLIKSFNEKNIFMIQGPPGTGKTTVIRELIFQTLKKNDSSRILIVSQANVAVDNVIRGLLKSGISDNDIIRIGKPDKIADDIVQISYENKNTVYQEAIKQKIETGNSISCTWNEILENSMKRSYDIGELLVRGHRIIGATCVGLAQRNIGLENMEFDLVIIDEAGKALTPEIIIPLNKAKKLVLIGDHKQLPPVIHPALYDPEKIELDERKYYKNEIFDISFFERMFINCPDSNKSTLTIQYRCPSIIGSMISKIFYGGIIKNGAGTNNKKTFYFDKNINLIDMSNVSDYYENEENGSPFNEYEAKYVIFLAQSIHQKNPDIRIAVITPYKGQKRKIIKTFRANEIDTRKLNVAIDTVDAFQGDEAEVVIYCTTRSKKMTNFFSDAKRINVALSRAKNELIILASVKYLQRYEKNTPIRMVLEYIKEYKCIRQPSKIDKRIKTKSVIDIIKVTDIYCDITYDIDDQLENNIEHEIDFYQKNGTFSEFPDVEKIENKYSILNKIHIYYAAKKLFISELTVNIKNSAVNSKIIKSIEIPHQLTNSY